jgi:hypothetical protein
MLQRNINNNRLFSVNLKPKSIKEFNDICFEYYNTYILTIEAYHFSKYPFALFFPRLISFFNTKMTNSFSILINIAKMHQSLFFCI